MFAMTSAYKLLQNENFQTISFTTAQKLIIQILSKTSLLCVLINRIKKSDSPVKFREKMLNFVVKYCENCMFCRAQVIIRGKTSHISWRHSTFLESSRQRQWSSAISWHQNNGKMAERDRSHVIVVLQCLKCNSPYLYLQPFIEFEMHNLGLLSIVFLYNINIHNRHPSILWRILNDLLTLRAVLEEKSKMWKVYPGQQKDRQTGEQGTKCYDNSWFDFSAQER